MKLGKILFLPIIAVFIIGFTYFHPVSAQNDNATKAQDLQNEIKELESKIAETQDRSKTLSSQISYMDSQIRLTQLQITDSENKISSLEDEIASLSGKIEKLEISLNELSHLLLERISETYKKGKISELELFFSAKNFSDFLSRFKYVQTVQAHDKALMYQIQDAKITFTDKRKVREDKKAEQEELKQRLLAQKLTLDKQKKEKANLLTLTKNDEKRYQDLLSNARAEYEAIESALRTALMELKNGSPIEKGNSIALIGNTGYPNCSTGTHLHFEITQNGERRNPTDFLKNTSVTWDNAPDGSFSFNGDWDWPIDNPNITQGYGMTYWARTGFYNGNPHTGIDMTSTNSIIKAPKNGTLYKGSSTCGSVGINYAAVDHGDGIISWYWHVQ